jgi:hypothetical protein
MPFKRENTTRRKIDTYYRDSNGKVWYLHSSQMYKTCKECTQSTREKSNLKAYESRVGEPLAPERIFSRFDSLYKQYDNAPRY